MIEKDNYFFLSLCSNNVLENKCGMLNMPLCNDITYWSLCPCVKLKAQKGTADPHHKTICSIITTITAITILTQVIKKRTEEKEEMKK